MGRSSTTTSGHAGQFRPRPVARQRIRPRPTFAVESRSAVRPRAAPPKMLTSTTVDPILGCQSEKRIAMTGSPEPNELSETESPREPRESEIVDSSQEGAEIEVGEPEGANEAVEQTSAEAIPVLPELVDLELELEYLPRVNLALQHNRVPLVRRLRLHHRGEDDWNSVKIHVRLEPAIGADWEAELDRLSAHSTHNFDRVDLPLSAQELKRVGDRGSAAIHVTVSTDRGVREAEWPLELLPYGTWTGLEVLPELLMAHVLPQQSGLAVLVGKARAWLEEQTGRSSIEGYSERDRARVASYMEGVFHGLRSLELKRVDPEEGFTRRGERIRTPDEIVSERRGTPLDLATLVAGALEQVGLFPLITLFESEVAIGVWTREQHFPDAVVDDALWVRKHAELGNIAMFGLHEVWSSSTSTFADAELSARHALATRDDYECTIDGRAARIAQVMPFGYRGLEHEDSEDASAEDNSPESSFSKDDAEVRDKSDVSLQAERLSTIGKDLETPPTESESDDRRTRWRRRLLDLSLRNRLLNFVSSKKTIPILVANPGHHEDALSQGRSFTIALRPDALTSTANTAADPDDQLRTQRAFIEDRLERGEWVTSLTGDELDRRLVEVYRTARIGLQEGGANTLFLAVGFLSWYETSTSNDLRRAPLLLLPLDLQRTSARSPFSFELAGEGPQINTTLIQKLESEFSLSIEGLDSLPEDESGVDVQYVLDRFREAIVDTPRWEVQDEVAIGVFSFTKFLMWRDLSDENPNLESSPALRILLGDSAGTVETTHVEELRAADDSTDPSIPQELDAHDLFCPLDADSSQLEAILAAESGQSFVLEGPPGTGKSQTITNLIAQAIARGKSVLFVSEKIAALEVVHRRLQKVGLGSACLELHSNKTRKSEVVARLAQALEPRAAQLEAVSTEEIERTLIELGQSQQALSAVVDRLHHPRPIGMSVYEALERGIELGVVHRGVVQQEVGQQQAGGPGTRTQEDCPQVDLRDRATPETPRDAWQERLAAIETLASYADRVGEPCAHRFRSVHRTHWGPADNPELEQKIDDAIEACRILEEVGRTLESPLGFERSQTSLDALTRLDAIAHSLLESPYLPASLLTDPDWSTLRADIEAWLVRNDEERGLTRNLEANWDVDRLVQLDLERIRSRIQKFSGSNPLWRWWNLRVEKRELKSIARGHWTWIEATAALEHGRQLLDLRDGIATQRQSAERWFGRLLERVAQDSTLPRQLLERAENLRLLAREASGENSDLFPKFRAQWGQLLERGGDELEAKAPTGEKLTRYRQAWSLFVQRKHDLSAALSIDEEIAWDSAAKPDFSTRFREVLGDWRLHLPELRDWCLFVRQREEADRVELGPLTRAWWRGEFNASQLSATFERSFLSSWAERVVATDDVLREFHGLEQSERVRTFREADRRSLGLNEARIEAILTERRPTISSSVPAPSEASEVGLVLREAKKKRSHLAVRELLRRIPNLLPRLKPCLLMSPLSVAQYLHWDLQKFDLVVFDEASQIPTWDAVGAIARAKSMVVVGDGKQLPPTSFFESSDGEEFELTESAELESILDECIAANLVRRRLRWHYRSRDENLIAFSNHHYYDGELVTFPHARGSASEYLGISRRRVEGAIYDRGEGQTNQKEAEALVDDLVRRLRSPEERDRSFGIVTFNVHQQMLVEDLLDAARRAHPEIDPHFHDSAPEPVFVKNLENVQGDERDVIFISVAYGRDARGRVSMNFGPLNRQGGERRLNVAITRAREQLVIWTDLEPEDLDLRRTGSVGVRHLKGFLEFAAEGRRAMAEASGDRTQSSLVRDLSSALRDRGWSVEEQVGSSDWKLELAVKAGDDTSRFIAAVETDGKEYARTPTVRDRDRLRDDVLAQLDWKTMRIWAIDWWQSRETELDRIDRVLQGHKEEAVSDLTLARSNRRSQEVQTTPTSRERTLVLEPAKHLPGQIDWIETAELARLADGSQEDEKLDDARCDQVRQEIEAAGPIAVEALYKRLAHAWEWPRMTRKVRARLEEIVEKVRDQVGYLEDDDGFIWPKDRDPGTYDEFRVPVGDTGREFDDIAPVEIRNATRALLAQHVAIPMEDLARDVSRVFGFARLTSSLREGVLRAVRELVAANEAELQDDSTVRLPQPNSDSAD